MATKKTNLADAPRTITPPKEPGVLLLQAEYGIPNFKWQMLFNSFTVSKTANGTMLKVAYVTGNTAAEIVSFLISSEGLEQLVDTSKSYVEEFTSIELFAGPPLPPVREFTPMFSNHVRLARSGKSGEMSLYTVPLKEIALALKASPAGKTPVNVVQVALLHSEVTVHMQLVLALMASAK